MLPWLLCTEEERFVELNTQKLAESKYLCPLSGKKFKGPDYVRKHIFNKHMDKVEDFKQEVSSKRYASIHAFPYIVVIVIY